MKEGDGQAMARSPEVKREQRVNVWLARHPPRIRNRGFPEADFTP
jgi:hypothetical protein